MSASDSTAQAAMDSRRVDVDCSVAPPALVKDVAGLVSPPDVCMKIFELMQSPTSSAEDMGEVIIQDPNLTARLLKIVNSPFYNFSRRIDTVSRAIAIVGTRDLYNLVVAISAVSSFSSISNTVVNMDTFWRHSMFTALIARSLAKRSEILHPERLFICGLLHDIGSLVLYNRMPEVSRDLLLLADGNEQALYDAERAELGFTHAELGALLLDLWNIPTTLQEAVRQHHSPERAEPNSSKESAIVYLASFLANQSEVGGYCESVDVEVELDEEIFGLLAMAPGDLDLEAVIGEAGVQFTESAGLLISK